ncbi:MAG: tetratricopeptide repeat protein [Verrucomicrobiota bacterium]
MSAALLVSLCAEEPLESLFQKGEITKAEDLLAAIVADPTDARQPAAALALADLYATKGETEKATRVLGLINSLPNQFKTRATAIEGRIALAEQRWDKAVSDFASVTNSTTADDTSLRPASLIGLADAYLGMNETQKADRVLRAFIEQNSNAHRRLLSGAFDRLEALGAFSGAEPDSDLVSWAQSPSINLKTLAVFHLADAALKARNLDLATHYLATLNSLNPAAVLSPPDLLSLASIHLELGEPTTASRMIAAIPEHHFDPHHTNALEAWTAFSSGDYAAAVDAFAQAARMASENEPESSIYTIDAGIAALLAGDPVAIAEATDALISLKDQKNASAFALERGLLEAARNQPQAVETLLALIKEFPDHPQLADAHIALAEILFLGIPSQPISARENLAAARLQPVSPDQAETIDYIAIWIEDSADAPAEAITLSREFIEKWPESDRVPSVRFKLGEIYFKKKSYQNALRHFLIVADQYADSGHADSALFYAAKSSWLMGSPGRADEAIALWGRLVDGEGPLKLTAWLEQGLAKMELGKEADAIAVFDSILVHDPPPQKSLLHSILTSKGQAAFNLSAAQASYLETAIASFSKVVTDPEASIYWRNQAAVRMAKCLEEMGKTEEALEIYGHVIQEGPVPTIDEPPEFDWFYRAGFAAIRLLEQKEDWRTAVAVAERLARSGGQRAQEATNLANKLRLEHFIWENAPQPPVNAATSG